MGSNKRKVIVFGGSFSPPTKAHEAIIRHSLSLPGYDEIWLIPSGNRTDKNIAVSPEQQLEMLHLLVHESFAGDPRLRIIDTELNRGIATETYDTYQEFLRDHPDTHFQFVFGADSYSSIHEWLNGEYLAENLPVMIVPRGNYPMPALAEHITHFPTLHADVSPISSTDVRSTAAKNETIDHLVPDTVGNYVQEKRLFKS
ncbi:nicotinate (nicotinamide) nucleotide adenylyltransferase [Candidatus Saccharibacteria bacterium]|nr:nicotinate (nicotinamide) nucleotide adenylyltransferase [Candidatus Saccharibacteria bacterium]